MFAMTAAAGAAADKDRRNPGRPLSDRAHNAIVAAVLAMLSAGVPAEALTIEAIAGTAGVGKATIYRRWPNKDALLVDAIAALDSPLPVTAGLSVRDDLLSLMRSIGATAVGSPSAAILACLIPELRRSPKLAAAYRRMVEPRRKLVRDVLQRGIDSGELRRDLDIDVVRAILIGPMLVQSVLDLDSSLEASSLADRLLAVVWPALAA
jgi:AcrR family transcriptional regulator